MTTKVKLCSNALLLIGHEPIDALEENQAASDLYEGIYTSLLTIRLWSFAKGKKQLSKLTASPLNEWRNAFQIPTEVLAIFKTYPKTDYQIYEDKILTQVDSLAIDYLFRIDESKIPPYFEKLVEYKLASEFAGPVTHKADLGKLYYDMYQDQLMTAAAIDSQQAPNVAEQHQPFITCRNV